MAVFTEDERAAQALDWCIQRDGGIAVYWQRRFFAEAVTWFAERDYRVVSFDCGQWTSVLVMHEDLAVNLSFPDYYGKNADALNDCIREDLVVPDEGGLVLAFERLDQFESNGSQMLLDILTRAIHFHMLLGRRLIVLIQTGDSRFHAEGLGATSTQWNRHEGLSAKRGLK